MTSVNGGSDVPPGVVGQILSDGDRWGDRFVAWRGTPDAPGWVPADEYVGAGLDPALATIRTSWGAPTDAVAGSLLVEAYAQRLVAPVLAAFALDGRVLDASPAGVAVELVDGRARRLAFARDPSPGEPTAQRRRMMLASLDAGLDPVLAAVHERTRVGRRVLRGAVANAVGLAYLHLSWIGPAADPAVDRARHVDTARETLDAMGLAGLVAVEAVDHGGRRWMYTDRRSCCLVFRTAHHAASDRPYCGTCPILPAEETRALFAEAAASFAARHPD